MEQAQGLSTSLSLLRKLCKAETDQQAWQAFKERYTPLVFHWCRRWGLQHADADAVTGTVLVQVFRRVRSYDPERGRFRAWLKTVVRHAVYDHRSEQNQPGVQGTGDSSVLDFLRNQEATPDFDELAGELDNGLDQDMQRVIARVRARVEPATWEAFWQTTISGRPAAEVAATLGLSVAQVYVNKHRVREMLAQEWAKLQD